MKTQQVNKSLGHVSQLSIVEHLLVHLKALTRPFEGFSSNTLSVS
jgi:hypothetical protein